MMTEASKDEQQSIMGSNTNIVRMFLKIGRVMVIAPHLSIFCVRTTAFAFGIPAAGFMVHFSFSIFRFIV
ncbi:hypothetical protein HMPREF3213_00827 [Heyndrickxia coagulans]|uniref:Uncharacterized protein n=1 Tax=Heyndrickxia coagulans TaxID=1398 RepID=A0A133KZ32_HEYCO|nr:hypothetical protein HMPREF3213_00827 [Heyndrickxia coagulans]